MGKELAVDIVLLFSKEVNQKVIDLNQKLEKENKEVELNQFDCFPHLSLSMIGIKEEDLEELRKKLSNLLENKKSFELEFVEVSFDEIIDKKKWANVLVHNSQELQQLHEEIMNISEEFNKTTLNKELFYNSEDINELTLRWAQAYKEKSSYNNFSPHISLGIGEFESKKFNVKTELQKIAVCQLGNYCTCRNILFEISFQ